MSIPTGPIPGRFVPAPRITGPTRHFAGAGIRHVAARALIEGSPVEVVTADKGYDSRAVVEAIEAEGAEAVIPA